MVVEVAPAELAAKRLGSLAARQPLLDLARGDAAEVEVGGEPRGAVVAERVVLVGVVEDRAAHERVESPACGRLATRRRFVDLLLEPQVGEARERAGVEAARQPG